MYKRIKKLFLNYIPTLIKTDLLYRIPYLYTFLEIKPTSCTIMITNRCNLKCIMCNQWREPAREELRTKDWKEIIHDLRKNGIRNIHFTGGEPLLRKDLNELISYCRRNGFVVGLTTNGILLKKEVLCSLLDAGLKSIAISIDAVESEYENIRGVPNSFEKAREALSIIAEMKQRNKIDAYINFTLIKGNIKEFAKVKILADSFKLPMAVCLLDRNSSIFNLEENKRKYWIREEQDFRELENLLSFLKNEKMKKPGSLLLNFPMIEFMRKYFRDPRQKDIPCVSSQDRIIIDPYGELLGGCLSMGSFGNIEDTPFSKLQRQQRYKHAKRKMFYKKCGGCSCGYQYNIRCLPLLAIKDIFERGRHLILKNKNV